MSVFQGSGDPSLSEGFGKRLMTPGGSVAPAPAPELFGCVVLENDRPEQNFLAGAGLFARGTSIAAGGAGTRSSVTLLNTAEDSLVVVESLTAAVASGLILLYSLWYPLGVLPTGSSAYGVARDLRMRTPAGLARQSSARVITDNTLGVPGGGVAGVLASSAQVREPWVLPPGGALWIGPNADNVAVSYVTLTWRERRLNQSERL